MIRKMVANVYDINSQESGNGNAALHYAVDPFYAEYLSKYVEVLLRCGADQNITNSEVETALYLAKKNESDVLIQKLLNNQQGILLAPSSENTKIKSFKDSIPLEDLQAASSSGVKIERKKQIEQSVNPDKINQKNEQLENRKVYAQALEKKLKQQNNKKKELMERLRQIQEETEELKKEAQQQAEKRKHTQEENDKKN